MDRTGNFGHWLRQRRKALGLTQKALAQAAGCAEVTLRKIESGDLQPSAPLVASLAQALGVDERDLPGLVSLARGAGDGLTPRTRLLRPQRPNNLPTQLTPLIGRESDITAVRRRLLADGARLVTLVGPPGVGKTRLALAVAEDVLEQFDNGAFFVRLAPISDPTLVAAAIAQALGLELSSPNPPELQLRAWLEEKHLLLALDNFEQIVAAAPLVDDLLRRCPWLHVLVTSRQPLRVRGERQVAVQPLALPSSAPAGSVVTAEDMLRYPAVELFADRAEAVLPDFAVDDGNAAAVAELCRRLDGLPLAIELVAARVKLLPPAELLGRLHGPWLLSTDGLRDVSARQKTLRGAIGWSYDLLSPAEQTLFRYLSVFVGGFTLEAAELLCGDTLSLAFPLPLSPTQILDGISSLLDKNLLQRESGLYGGTRYVMLETVREYGLERLAASGEEQALRERHARCFLQLIENADRTELDPSWVRVRLLVSAEIDNVRAALAWAKLHDVEAALRLVTALVERAASHGPYAEGLQAIDEVFALPGVEAPTIARAKALHKAGILLLFGGQNSKAETFEEESLALSQELRYGKGEADALLGLGRVAHTGLWDQKAAKRCFERALTVYRQLGDPAGVAFTLALLGEIPYWQGDFAQGRALMEESLAVARQASFLWAYPVPMLAHMDMTEGYLDGAEALSQQGLAILRRQASTIGTVHTLVNLGDIATRRRDFAAARVFLEEAEAVIHRLGLSRLHIVNLPLADLLVIEGDHERALQLCRQSWAFVEHDQSWWGAYLVRLAALAEALGQHELLARLVGATEAAADATGYPLLDEREAFERLVSKARAHLDATSFDIARARGREQGFEPAAQEALAILEATLAR